MIILSRLSWIRIYSYLFAGIAGKSTEPYGRFDLNIFRKKTTFNSLLIPFFSTRSLLIEQRRRRTLYLKYHDVSQIYLNEVKVTTYLEVLLEYGRWIGIKGLLFSRHCFALLCPLKQWLVLPNNNVNPFYRRSHCLKTAYTQIMITTSTTTTSDIS